MILQTMNDRVMRVQTVRNDDSVFRVLIVGTQYDIDCHQIRDFLSANRIPYEWVDRVHQPERVPADVSADFGCPAGRGRWAPFAHPPTVRTMADALQLQTQPPATATTW